MAILLKAIYGFSAIPIKLPMAVFTELEQRVQKFIWNKKKKQTQNCQSNPEGKKKNAKGITFLDFQQYYKAIVITTMSVTDTKTDIWTNGTE